MVGNVHTSSVLAILTFLILKKDCVNHHVVKAVTKMGSVLLFLALAIGSCSANPPPGLIPEVATNLGLSGLVNAVVSAGLKDTLDSAGPFTVFAPTNEAFAKLPASVEEEVKDTKVLAAVLKYHVLSGKVFSKDLKNELLADTVQGEKLRINLYNVGGNTVATAQCAPIDLNKVDQAASNGVIHVLNAVMIPPTGNIVATAVAQPSTFSTLVSAVQAAGLVDVLSGPGPFTVFAPTDDAFNNLPAGALKKLLDNPAQLAGVLKYHVVSGTFCSSGLTSGDVTTVEGQDVTITVSSDGVEVNDANVISADVSVTNGVIHVIDTVLLPPDLDLS